MKPFIRDTLQRHQHRLQELDALLSAPDVVNDMDRFRRLTREHADAQALATAFDRYLRCEADVADATHLQADADPDMAALGEEALAQAQADMVALEQHLQLLLLPKDADDQRSAYLEIRAGTGGDESALFAGDLARMYTRYATAQGMTVELISESPSELGATKRWCFAWWATVPTASCGSSRVGTGYNVCLPPKPRAAYTPAPAPWP